MLRGDYKDIYSINISVSSIGRILTQYQSILPKDSLQTKRIRALKKNKVRLSQVKDDIDGIIFEWLQIDTIELNLRFNKVLLFSAFFPPSRLYYIRCYKRVTFFSAHDFLCRLVYLNSDNQGHLQVDNGSEWEMHFSKEVQKRQLILVRNYLNSPKMDTFVQRVNGSVQSEYLDRFYEETSIDEINKILFDCLVEYNFYRPHRSLNLLTPIGYCSKLLNNKDTAMLQICILAQTKYLQIEK